MRKTVIASFFCLVCVLAVSSGARASDGDRLAAVADVAGAVDTSKLDTALLVRATTGINPDDYPCARAAILKLYESRDHISRLSSWHPQRIFTWMTDQFEYYSVRLTRWVMGFFDSGDVEGAVQGGIRNIESMARGGRISNPLASMDRQVENWIDNLGPRSQEVLANQVSGLIAKASGPDGLCK